MAAVAFAWLAAGIGPAGAAERVAVPQGAVAVYHGRVIDLGDGWDGASICAVYSAVDVRCYDNDAEFHADARLLTPGQASAQAMSDCYYGWACVWEHVNFAGRRLQFREPGSAQPLSEYSFRDMTSSLWNNLPAGKYFDIIDYRTGMSDPYLAYRWAEYGSDLTREPYPGGIYGGGSWNDRADAVRVRQI